MARALVKTFQAEQPVGTVIQSLLTEAQFQTEYGTSWILADGRDVTGSKYDTVTGNSSAPDLRGRFLRSKNNGRISGGNPDGEYSLGQEQGQGTAKNALTASSVSTGAHTHTQRASFTTGNVGSASLNGSPSNTNMFSGDQTLSSGNHSHTINIGAGNNETRPVSTTVNLFMKIN